MLDDESEKKTKGKHGGFRHGGGRKAKTIPQSILDRVGPPPYTSPLKMARWWVHLVAEATWLFVQGELPAETLDKIRAVAASSAKILPEDIRAEAERLIRAEEDAKHADQDSPDLESVDAGRSLRG